MEGQSVDAFRLLPTWLREKAAKSSVMINGIVIDKKSRMVYKYEAAKIKVGLDEIKQSLANIKANKSKRRGKGKVSRQLSRRPRPTQKQDDENLRLAAFNAANKIKIDQANLRIKELEEEIEKQEKLRGLGSVASNLVLSATMKALERPQEHNITSLPRTERLFTGYKTTKDEDTVDCGLLVGIFSFR